MAQSLPALRGKFGSTEFYLVTMKASEFVRTVIVPKEMDGWENLSVEEKFQREINYKRVKDKMAPYLATDPDRFFGAFIVTVRNHENLVFSPLNENGLLKNNALLPSAFGTDVGILILEGQQLVPLDGQHRLAALKMAITGKDEKDNEIPGVPPTNEVGEDYVTAILVRDDPQKSRKIFNKVNRYAKPTSAADNLITSDDDFIAVVCREHVVGAMIDSRIVQTGTSNTISPKAKEFTTLNTIYKISKRVVEAATEEKVATDKVPPPATQQIWRKLVVEFWEEFLDVTAFHQSIHDSSADADYRRAEIRGQMICCKPIVMEAMAEAICILRHEQEDAVRPTIKELVKRFNTVNWDRTDEMWIGSLLQMGGEKVITGPSAMKFAGRFLAYLVGWKPDAVELKALKHTYALNTGGIAQNDGSIAGGKELRLPVV